MRKLLTILFILVSAQCFAGFISISFPADGHLIIGPSNGLVAGDIVRIKKGTTILPANTDNMTVTIFDIHGGPGNPIIFEWDPTDAPIINNTAWNGGPWADGLGINNCTRIVFRGTALNPIQILCGKNDANRQNELNVNLNNFTHKIEVAYLQIWDGGTGMQIKTEGTADSLTWFGRTLMDSIYIHHVGVHNSGNEGFYMGPTSMFIKVAGTDSLGYVQENTFCSTPLPDTVVNALPRGFYKRVNVYHKFTFHDNTVDSSGADAFQFAAIDSLTVYNLRAKEWALFNANGHKGGLLIGSYSTNTYAHDIVLKHSANGCGIWHFAEGPNNLCYNILIDSIGGNDPVSVKGGKPGECGNNYTVTFDHITITRAKYTPLYRLSPNMGAVDSVMVKNGLSASLGPDPGFGVTIYYHTEGPPPSYNVAQFSNQNLTYATYTDAVLDADNFMQPLPGTPVGDEGYRISVLSTVNHIVKRVPMGSRVRRYIY